MAPGSLCAGGTLAVPYLLYRLFTHSSSSSLFSGGMFQRQCSTSTCLSAPLCLSAVVLSPPGLLRVLPCYLLLLSKIPPLFCLVSFAWLPSCCRCLFSLSLSVSLSLCLPCGDSQESLRLPAQVMVLVLYNYGALGLYQLLPQKRRRDSGVWVTEWQ